MRPSLAPDCYGHVSPQLQGPVRDHDDTGVPSGQVAVSPAHTALTSMHLGPDGPAAAGMAPAHAPVDGLAED